MRTDLTPERERPPKRRRAAAAVLITTAGLGLALTWAAGPAWSAPSVPTDQKQNLILLMDNGNLLTVDPTVADSCQQKSAGNGGLKYRNIAIAPDNTVYGILSTAGQLVKVGTYDEKSTTWASDPKIIGKTGPAIPEGLVALNNRYALAAARGGKLWKIDLRTGDHTALGATPTNFGGDLTWTPNGDLLAAGTGGFMYRLSRDTLESAYKGRSTVKPGDWIDLGWLVDWSTVRGMATDTKGNVFVANDHGTIYRLDSTPDTQNWWRWIGSANIRDFSSHWFGWGQCPVSGYPQGMTIVGDTELAPNFDRDLVPGNPSTSIKGFVGDPVNATLPGRVDGEEVTYTVTDPAKAPAGVTIKADGTVTGVPTKAGNYSVPVKACNELGCTTGSVTLAFEVDPACADQDKPAPDPAATTGGSGRRSTGR